MHEGEQRVEFLIAAVGVDVHADADALIGDGGVGVEIEQALEAEVALELGRQAFAVDELPGVRARGVLGAGALELLDARAVLFRRLFKRLVGLKPSDYRRMFLGVGTAAAARATPLRA